MCLFNNVTWISVVCRTFQETGSLHESNPWHTVASLPSLLRPPSELMNVLFPTPVLPITAKMGREWSNATPAEREQVFTSLLPSPFDASYITIAPYIIRATGRAIERIITSILQYNNLMFILWPRYSPEVSGHDGR